MGKKDSECRHEHGVIDMAHLMQRIVQDGDLERVGKNITPGTVTTHEGYAVPIVCAKCGLGYVGASAVVEVEMAKPNIVSAGIIPGGVQ